MNREVQAAVLLVVGVVLLRLALSDAYLAYVKDTLWVPLLASSMVLLALGVLSLVRDHEDVLAADGQATEHGDGPVRQVLITGSGPDLPDDTWVEVVATFEGAVLEPDGGDGGTGVPSLRAIEQRVIERPASPYEY